MKGIVFTEFIEFIENAFSPEMADDIIDDSDLASGGAYTSVGTYDHTELLQLVSALSKRTETPVADLVQVFGKHMFPRLTAMQPVFLEGMDNSFEFLQTVDNHIHVEVQKLYPDAELPRFSFAEDDKNYLRLTYRSRCPFGDFAHGLIEGCAEHFGESLTIEREELPCDQGHHIHFHLTKKT